MQTLINTNQITKINIFPKMCQNHYYWKKGIKIPILNKLFPEGFYFSTGRHEFYHLEHFSKEQIENDETAYNDYYKYNFQTNYYVEDNMVYLKPYIMIYFSNNSIEGKEFENVEGLNTYISDIKKLNTNIIFL